MKLQAFGPFVAAGCFLAVWLIAWNARRKGLPDKPVWDASVLTFILGAVGGHLVHLFLYHPEELTTKGPLQILRLWDGLSSLGGLLGGFLGVAITFAYRRVPKWNYGDAFALGVAPGWGVARLGCFAVHDHPGIRSDFFLAVDFPGGPRHDLGLYDALWLFVLTAVLYALDGRGLLKNRLIAVLAVGYGAVRFGFDFLRAREGDLSYVDGRYLGLTPGQFIALGLVLFGTVFLIRPPKLAPWPAAPPSVEQS